MTTGDAAAGQATTGDGTADPDRLRRLLGGPDTAWLLARVRHRLEHGTPLTGTVTLSGATAGQRRAVESLLGRRAGRGASLSVSLDEVDRVLRASGACPGGLAPAVALLDGRPIRDLARESAEAARAWQSAHTRLDAAVSGRDDLAAWRAWLDSTGLVRRLAPGPDDARSVLDRLAAVLDRLPSPGVPLGRLAAETCGDAHALDAGSPLATLAFSAARALAGLPFRTDGGAESRRSVWTAVGVHIDELSSLVLCLGLPGDGTLLGRLLDAAGATGEPVALTLRQLRRHPEPLPAAGLVRICENPVVVAAAADALGDRCPPLVCAGGRPSAAVWRLLESLAAGGAEFAYHGDFDWGGIGIATALHERVGWRPWRYDTAAYLAAVRAAPSASSGPSGCATSPGSAGSSVLLSGRPRRTPWDPGLEAAMVERGVRVEEELVLTDLLTDLEAARPKL